MHMCSSSVFNTGSKGGWMTLNGANGHPLGYAAHSTSLWSWKQSESVFGQYNDMRWPGDKQISGFPCQASLVLIRRLWGVGRIDWSVWKIRTNNFIFGVYGTGSAFDSTATHPIIKENSDAESQKKEIQRSMHWNGQKLDPWAALIGILVRLQLCGPYSAGQPCRNFTCAPLSLYSLHWFYVRFGSPLYCWYSIRCFFNTVFCIPLHHTLYSNGLLQHRVSYSISLLFTAKVSTNSCFIWHFLLLYIV